MNSRPGPFTRFFWFCSGANTRILQLCPQSEHNRFVGIGAAVFFTGLLAAFSGGYALYTAFNSVVLGIIFGILWGGIIFNLDRFMVSTIKKEGTSSQQMRQALPRLLLALVLAIVIAKPLELRIFEPEIMEVLENRKRNKLEGIEQTYLAKVKESNTAISQLKETLIKKEAAREKDYQDYKCECDGTCGTGKIGRGSECERKEKKYLQTHTEYQQLKTETDTEIADIRQHIQEVEGEGKAALASAKDVFAYGLVARLDASGELPLGPSIMIPLLIFLVEISPILAKILSPRGPYDEGLKIAEDAFRLAQSEVLEEQKLQINQKKTLQENLAEAELEQQVWQRRRAMQALSNAQLELVKEQVDRWLKEEKEKLR